VRGNPKAMERFGIEWTPTVLVLDGEGKQRHRIEGFLEADDFLGQLLLGLGHVARAENQWDRARELYGRILDELQNTHAAPEAQYWRGVAKYKATNDPAALGETAQAFREKYSESPWAQKASVWRPR
jgi:hypothetical protein